MVIRRCPKCGATTDDQYGFCIKCGYEFPKIKNNEYRCTLCGYTNPNEADFCVKCGTPLFFKNKIEKNNESLNPIVIKKEIVKNSNEYQNKKTSSWLIILGYIFAIFGSVIGLIIGIYLSTRDDPLTRRHGHVQIGIIIFYILLLIILFATGLIPQEMITNYRQLLAGNFSSM